MDKVQYCVVLRGGPDKGIRQYRWSSREKMKKLFDSYRFDCNEEVIIDLGHVVGNKKGELSAKAHFNKKILVH